MTAITATRDWSGRLSTIDPLAPCPGCSCEPEAIEYRTRQGRRRDNGEQVTIRVGYRCSCGAVVIDGQFVMHQPPSRGDW